MIAGLALGRADVIEAAGAIARALGDTARLAFFPPEANSMGLALIGGAGLEACVERLEDGTARTVILTQNDLFERAEATLVDRLFAAASEVIVLGDFVERTGIRLRHALFEPFVPDRFDTSVMRGARGVMDAARQSRRLQTGKVRDYVLALTIGLATLLILAWGSS